MGCHLFPFTQIPQGAEVVLWGAGDVGREYYRQVSETMYCKIIGIIDRNAIDEDNLVGTKEILKKKFDYIVIAVANPNVAEEIKRELIKENISLDKIVMNYVAINNTLLFTDKIEELLKINVIKNIIKKYLDGIGDFTFFDEIINKIKEYKQKDNFKIIFKEMVNELSLKEKVVWLRVLLWAECFDEEMLKIYMKSISDLKNKELVICLLYEIVWKEVSHHEYRYDNYYTDRRNLIRNNTESILNNYELIPFVRKKFFVGEKIKRICILRQNMPPYDKSEATRLTIQWANELAKLGYEVIIFINALMVRPNVISFINFNSVYETNTNQENRKYLRDGVTIVEAEGLHIKDKMVNTLQNIYEINPDLIIDACADYEMLTCVLHKYYPIIQIPLRGVNSCTFHHRCVVGSKEQFEREVKRFQSIDPEKMRFICRYPRLELETKYEWKSERKLYGIPDKAFVCVTVGTRVGIEVTEKLVEAVCKFLNKYQDAVWIIAGNGEFRELREEQRKLIDEGRIILWGYENNLDTFYIRIGANIFISPKVTGNGGCAYKAMRSGTPVLINEVSGDIEHLVGKERMVMGGYDELMGSLEEYYLNKDRLALFALEQKNIINNLPTAEDYVKYIMKVAQEIIGEEFTCSE